MRTYSIALALLLILTADAEARMYQWTSPDSGTVQLSGQPPAWYRAIEPGPRVRVFDNGELVDDTRVTVPEIERQSLRSLAFGGADVRDAPAGVAEDEAVRAALKDALAKAQEQGIDVNAVSAELHAEQAAAGTVDAASALAEKVTTLKSLIEAWDQRQLDSARAILDTLPTDDAGASARQ